MVESSDKTRRAIVLLTDGEDTSSMLKLDDAVQEALKTDTLVFAIGIGDSFGYSGVDEGSLRKITERTGGRAYFPRSEEDLRVAFAQIQRELREQFLVAYSPTNKRRDGSYRKLQIEIVNPELRKQNVKLNYRQGYFAKSDAAPATRRRK
jgi:VWFA-related protein